MAGTFTFTLGNKEIEVEAGSLIVIPAKPVTASGADQAGEDARTARAWAQGLRARSVEAERRLRYAYAVVDLLLEVESPETVRAWSCGMNPNLDDQAPILALATMPKEVLQAARAFVATGWCPFWA